MTMIPTMRKLMMLTEANDSTHSLLSGDHEGNDNAGMEKSEASEVTVWHVTRKASVARIMRQGLMPRRGARSRSAGETQPAIFVFPDSISLEDGMTNWLDDEFEDIPVSLLELTVPRAWLTQHAIRWEAAIMQPVPPDRIRVLVPDMDAWHGESWVTI